VRPLVSVVIPVKDVEKYIGGCIESLLNQSFRDFEIIVVGDGSEDCTAQEIRKFQDEKIRYYENEKNLGIAKSRNKGVRLSRGKYIFFTDGDCITSRDWIEEGLRYLTHGCAGVEGRICYVSEDYKRTFSDHVSENKSGGQFMTGNMAYARSAIEQVGGFDETYTYFEDRDLALRIMRIGGVTFNSRMVVYAQQQTLTPKGLLGATSQIKNRVRLFRKLGERELMIWRCVKPRNLVRVVFPPLVFLNLLFHRFNKSDDFKVLPFTYVFAVCERLQLWKECARERVFLI
jgi:glycosyltransferase involved in cell wall biosynthesis